MSANIKFWVLTGDKPETALEIAKSCRLVRENFKLISFRSSQIVYTDEEMLQKVHDLQSQILTELDACISQGIHVQQKLRKQNLNLLNS